MYVKNDLTVQLGGSKIGKWVYLYYFYILEHFSTVQCAHLPRCDAVIIIIDFSCTCLLLTMDKSMIQIMEFLTNLDMKRLFDLKL